MNIDLSAIWPFLLLLPLVAFLYSSVGHGGASGYLALMALFSFPASEMRPSALLLNLFVAAISFYYFWKQGHFRWKLFYPFAVSSIPASFIGGMWNVEPSLYRQILGVLLVFAIMRLLGVFGSVTKQRDLNMYSAILIGAVIGLLSGLIGIGGGIILSPIILLLGWGNVKETAAVSALFIWVNSAAGMGGLMSAGVYVPSQVFVFVVLAVIGGAFGGYFGSNKIPSKPLRIILALVLLIASIKLMLV